MIRKSHLLLALALVAAAVTAPIAQSSPKPVDPMAVSYLMGMGLSPSQVRSWTAGACSHQVKAPSCYAMLGRSAASTKPVDPLAVGYLMGQRLAPSEVTAWTTGICSHQVKDASCYAMLRPAATRSTQLAGSARFQWEDAGIGAGFALGVILLLGTGTGLLISRQHRHHKMAARVSASSS